MPFPSPSGGCPRRQLFEPFQSEMAADWVERGDRAARLARHAEGVRADAIPMALDHRAQDALASSALVRCRRL